MNAPAHILPRSHGRAEIALDGARLTRLFQQGCAKILLPRGRDEAVFTNTAGGITGGDRIALAASLGAGDRLTMTTQAAERIYRSAGGVARVTNELTLAAGARLDWLPQETILFNGAALDRCLTVHMAGDAQLLALETLIFGRAAHGEVITRLHLRDNWRIHRGGRLIHAESLRLDGLPGTPATTAGIGAAATLVLAAPGVGDRLDAARAMLTGAAGATAPLPDLLVVRLLAPSGQALRAMLIPLIHLLRGSRPPRVWQL
ncbi:MAG: urease accessory protein UreD [Paracoccus sp. (in: a-proteobacteria)]|uniref:urease accessory protein UreD n=1 Tax=Paracoccus sp. TaxID=267 RepID=UPI0026DECCCF|nr:urease accessory protein UreD [Paracoccus sp. (in: a-proteobacteria)]MDO5620247.1 urease accessory protein UreD [Paracoccus sp. (in: a-proteobacteria)]